MSSEEAVITFPISFATETESAESVVSKSPEETEALEKLEDFLKDTDAEGLKRLQQYAKNPSGAVENELLGLLGKAGIHGAIAVAIIGLIIATPEIIMAITKALAVKGGPLNQDYHRFFNDETQLGLTREMQYRRSVGLDVIITSDNRGFLLQDPGFVTNNLVDVDETRAIRTSSNETEYGYVSGM